MSALERAAEPPLLAAVQPASVAADSAGRRAVDVLAACVGLVVASPVLAAVGVAVRLGSAGPALFRQERVGVDGTPFTMLKFRTMRTDAEAVGPSVSGNEDPRVTRVGALLRRTKLDELPQLVNVLRGDMTLIGPRAEVPRYVEHYTAEERETLSVRPGLTGPGGIWFTVSQAAELDGASDPEQVYVDRQLHEKLALDLDYLGRRTLLRDLRILAQTVGVALRR